MTTGTIFHGRKLAVRDIPTAIAVFADGHGALQLGRDLDVSYKTAFVPSHKTREALGRETIEREASGVVEVDGACFGGHVKPADGKGNRRDCRLGKNQGGKRRVVAIMRERGGRTLPFVVRYEHHAGPTLEARIAPGSTVHADEARSWDTLRYAGLDVRRVNHQEAYSDDDGDRTNRAESSSRASAAPRSACTITSPGRTSPTTRWRWRGARTPGGLTTAPRCCW